MAICRFCKAKLTQVTESVDILENVSSYIKEKLIHFKLNEKCVFNIHLCNNCEANIKKEKEEIEKRENQLKSTRDEQKKTQIKEEIEKIQSCLKEKEKDKKELIKNSTKNFIKKHQKWFCREFLGDYLNKSIKKFMVVH